MDIKTVSNIAGEIEVNKPVYLFAPELGSINLQALVMLLKNNTVPDSPEVVNALNTLLVTTSDANFAFDIGACLELVDMLAEVGLKTLDKIVAGGKRVDPYEDTDDLDTHQAIDEVFKKYINPRDIPDENIVYNVDSLTGNVEDEDSDMEVDVFSPVEAHSSPDLETPEKSEDIPTFQFFDYLTMLNGFKDENKYHFSTLQTKSAVDDQVLVVDELITVTMILRNISFSGVNKYKMSSNELLRDLVFGIVRAVGLYLDKFVFNRKRLCVLKDCLFLLYNISHDLELRTLEEAFLSYVLISSFGPDLGDCRSIPLVSVERFSYMPYAIDTFTKLLVREPHNRSFMNAVLTGSLSAPGVSIKIHDSDRTTTRKMICDYLKSSDITSGELLTRSFNFFLSILPLDTNSLEFSRFIDVRTATVTQALFGVKLLIDLIPKDEESPLRFLTTKWLVDNEKLVVMNINKISLSLIPESTKNGLLALVLLKILIMVNSLLANSLNLIELEENNEETMVLADPLMKKLQQLLKNYRIYPDKDLSLETLLNPMVDKNIANELIRQFGLIRNIESKLSN